MTLRGIVLSTLHVSALSLRSLRLLVVARRARSRAKKIFHQTLVSEGISERDAEDIAEAYPDPVKEIMRYIAPIRSDWNPNAFYFTHD